MNRYKDIKEMVEDYRSKSTMIDKESAKILIRLLMREIDDPNFPEDMWEELSNMTHIHLAVEKRLSWIYQFRLSRYAITWMTLSFKNIGDCIVILAVIQCAVHEHPELKNKELTVSDLSRYVIPDGYPTESDRRLIWDKQKVDLVPDNMVDHVQFYNSIL